MTARAQLVKVSSTVDLCGASCRIDSLLKELKTGSRLFET